MQGLISYRPLSMLGREIRLLRIDARREHDGGEGLQCAIEHMMLDSGVAKSYAATSYCWGANVEEAFITVDGRKVKVPHSAASALSHLAQEPGELIWIDALCINQEDNVEKGRQVAMMKDIYTQASEVRIWLGNLEDDVAVNAINSARSIYQQCLRETNNLGDLQLHLYGTGETMSFKYSDAALPENCDWNALQALYLLPWFTRLWVVQEVALARKGICQVGTHKVDADIITLAARWMVHRQYPKHFGGSQIEGIENASSMYRPTARPLSNQLRRMHRQRCKDPRDRIYGLLGLLKPPVAAAIVPDYSSPLVDVYAHALYAAIEEDGSLDILRFSAWFVDEPTDQGVFRRLSNIVWQFWYWLRASQVHRTWPSWVLKIHGSTESAHGSCLNVQVFEKSDWPFQLKPSSDPFTLTVKGLKLSRISYVSEPLSTNILQNSTRLASIVLRCTKQAAAELPYANRASRLEELRLIFVCGINAQNRDAETDETLKPEYDAFIEWCEARNSKPADQEQPPPRYVNRMWRSMNRRFFITGDGMMGMSPHGTRVGDHICILSGTAGAFILRSEGRSWKLIGDGYCPSLMKKATRDALFGHDIREEQSQWFDIC